MSSFYGSGFYGSSSGGGGSSDSGITTLTGTEDSPIVLNTLDEGNYIIEGYYIYTETDTELKQEDGGLGLFVTYDSTSNQKVGKWESYDNSTFYINIISFQSNENYSIDKIAVRNSGQGGDSNVIFTNILPTIGEEDVLYVTADSIFRYIDDNYINLTNEMTWGNF